MLFLVRLAGFWGVEGGNREKKRGREKKREVVFFHPIPLLSFPSRRELRERRWVSAEPVLVGWRGVEWDRTAFPWGKTCWEGGRDPRCRVDAELPLFRVRAGCGRDRCWVWWSCSSNASPDPGVSPRKKGPSASQPPTCPLIRAH